MKDAFFYHGFRGLAFRALLPNALVVTAAAFLTRNHGGIIGYFGGLSMSLFAPGYSAEHAELPPDVPGWMKKPFDKQEKLTHVVRSALAAACCRRTWLRHAVRRYRPTRPKLTVAARRAAPSVSRCVAAVVFQPLTHATTPFGCIRVSSSTAVRSCLPPTAKAWSTRSTKTALLRFKSQASWETSR